jgi:hypothetical protein
MKSLARRLLAVALLVPTVLNAPVVLAGYRENQHVTSVELAQLPKFCWAQMEMAGATGRGYSIERSECGDWTNHYCPGLVTLIRFKKSANKSQQLSLLLGADGDVGYTEKGIKDFPQCSIRGHVAATRTEINTFLSIYGKKGSKSPPPAR